MTTAMAASAWTELPDHRRIILMTDGYSTPHYAKTAMSLLRYRPSEVVAVLDQEHAGKTADQLFKMGHGVPVIGNLHQVPPCDSLYMGIATAGGKLPEAWRPIIRQAIEMKMDIVSGLHDFLVEDTQYVQLAQQHGSRLVDVRRNRYKSTAKRREFPCENIRIHSVGNDCSVGKMVVALEVQKELSARGYNAQFAATGQTGIMISGNGVPVDCVVSDFVNGAVEELVGQHERADFVLIEGQGSLAHPAFSAVTAGLLHGCAPQGLLFCYEANRKQVKGLDSVPIVDIERQLAAFETMANLRYPCQVIGMGINTRSLTPDQAQREVEQTEARFGLPACDVYRQGASKLADACEQLRRQLLTK